jgi:hypothetical protein
MKKLGGPRKLVAVTPKNLATNYEVLSFDLMMREYPGRMIGYS